MISFLLSIFYFYYYFFNLNSNSYLIFPILYLLLEIKKNNQNNIIQYKSIIKDKEFILFKTNLFNLYYSSLIILFIYLLKNNYLYCLLDFNIYFINLFTTIFIIYSILFSNKFNFKLFNLTKKIINLFNSINLDFSLASFEGVKTYSVYPKYKFNLTGLRYYSTNNNADKNLNNSDPSIVANEPETQLIGTELELNKFNAVQELKKKYKGGYLGYTLIKNFGNISNYFDIQEAYFREICIKDLASEFKEYLGGIPENTTYSILILPVIRWQFANGSYESITVSNSIKITRFSSSRLLAEVLYLKLQNKFYIYNLRGLVTNLFIMGRPWLNIDDFNIKLPELTEILDKQIEIEFSSPFKDSWLENKAQNLLNYKYKDVYKNNYGDKVLDKNNNLIGYKLDDNSYVTVETFYNENNLLCNKVSVKEFNLNLLTFNAETFLFWVDIKTEFGFIRDFNNIKYYYNHKNILFNIEKNLII